MQQTNTMQLNKKFKKAATLMQLIWTVKKTAHQYNRKTWVQHVVKRNIFSFDEDKTK